MPLDPIALAQDVHDAPTFERLVLDELAVTVGFEAAFFAAVGDPPTAMNVEPTVAAALAMRGVAARRMARDGLPRAAGEIVWKRTHLAEAERSGWFYV